MTFRFEPDDLMAMRAISRLPEGRRFIDLLNRRLQHHDTNLRKLTGDAIGWTQGRAQELAELVEAIETADLKLQPATPTQRSAVWTGPRA